MNGQFHQSYYQPLVILLAVQSIENTLVSKQQRHIQPNIQGAGIVKAASSLSEINPLSKKLKTKRDMHSSVG